MSQKVKIGGVWKDAIPYAKVGSTWKLPKSVYNKVNGVWKSSFLQGGINDSTFTDYDVYTGLGGRANSVTIQSDGKILIGGFSSQWNGIDFTTNFFRLNSDQTLDTEFVPYVQNGPIDGYNFESIVQPDGKILVGGDFTSWNGTATGRLVRLNSDGALDTTFTTNAGSGADGYVSSIAIQSDGKILAGGSFYSWNGTEVKGIARLSSNGTIDTVFTSNIGSGPGGSKGPGRITLVQSQADGKILVGGEFLSWNGTTIRNLVRLNSDGTLDTAFTTNSGSGAVGNTVDVAVMQSDGKILIGGSFSSWNGTATGSLARLNSDGTLDTAFNTNAGSGAGGNIFSIVIQADGKILAGGNFITWNGTTIRNLVRLNSDGTRDTNFTTNVGSGPEDFSITAAPGSVYSIAIQTDGKILVVGEFTTWSGKVVNRIARLNSSGTLDTTFSNNTGSAADGNISSIAVQSDRKIVVGGSFTTWGNVRLNRLGRLNLDGTLDTTFNSNLGSGANATVSSIAIQSDGKILAGGTFTTWNGTTVNRIVRLNSDGTRDTTFTTNTGTAANGQVVEISIQADGKILVGGVFTIWNDTTVNRIVRLNSDGTRDTSFSTSIGNGPNNVIYSMVAQTDGKILVGGAFTSWNGNNINRAIRLNSDGTIDNTYSTNFGTAANNIVLSIVVQPDGKTLMCGTFTTWNGTTVNRIVRLNSDGTRDTTFTTNTGTAANDSVSSIAIQPNGKIIISGSFLYWNGAGTSEVVRLNSDGTRDTAFTTNFASQIRLGNGSVTSIVIQQDGKILISGNFVSLNNSIVRNRIARLGGDFAG
jgi:uncharacterized delta-60 repeat protein